MAEVTPSQIHYLGQLSRGLVVLLAFLALGELLVAWRQWPVPGNVVGMILLTAALLARLLPRDWVEPIADALLSRLGLFFVPPGVGVMVCFGQIRQEWLPLLVATLGSLLAVLAVTGWVAGLLARREPGEVQQP